jgi:hypothetical protein
MNRYLHVVPIPRHNQLAKRAKNDEMEESDNRKEIGHWFWAGPDLDRR